MTPRPGILDLLDQYPWIFVDEYQDCCAVQDGTIQMFRREGTSVTVIGDKHQNLYHWRGTDPEFLEQFENRGGGRARRTTVGHHFWSPQAPPHHPCL